MGPSGGPSSRLLPRPILTRY